MRSRPMVALCSGTALMNASMAAASATSTLVAADRLGAGWGGVPNTAGIVGTGLGALALTRLVRRMSRRATFVLGYAAAGAGACLAAVAVANGDVVGLCLGLLLLGLGNAGAQLSRYAAADLRPPGRRGSAIGLVVWCSAAGAVGGPLLLDPSGAAATAIGWTAFTGPFLLAALTCAAAALAATGGPRVRAGAQAPPPFRRLVRTPAARSALTVMVTAQVVMVAVMTAAPLEMHMHGDGLGAVGMTLSAHTLGMFALSPVSGRLFDRFGHRPVILGGLLTLALSTALAAVATGSLGRPVALFLLGYGWNLCFVGGSGRLARDLPEAERPHVEGAVDAAVWMIAAAASLLSTVVLSAGGYSVLAWTSCAAALAVTLTQSRRRRPALQVRAEPAGPVIRQR
ncbi:MFS transporter [Actinomadura darangshiensis]|uniref:MFS transporter n=1 Tax=Actinomadura darangshiensis TaxID=705336 RepID=A0A4R4ZYT6_9ACTN|nr:MFS transporter [Actinomadura darangshiensis]TDD64473.1 MFS transporter [Actinomadura darangshiensis]